MGVGDPVRGTVHMLRVRFLDLLAIDGDGAVCRAVTERESIATEDPES